MLVFFLSSLFAQPPTFSGDNAYARLKELVAQGHRYYAAPNRTQQIKTMHDVLDSYGWNVLSQSFDVLEPTSNKEYTLTNIIAIDPKPAQKRFILGTHWDTRLWAEEDANPFSRNKPIAGANDGSSGVALLLELAETIQKHPLQNIALDIIFFDGEEFGRPHKGGYCKGSEYFVAYMEDVYPYKPTGVVVLDMIADADLRLEKEAYSVAHSPRLWKQVQQHLQGQDIPFSKQRRSIRDDQHPFLQKDIPAILLIDLSYPYWHTHQDTIDKCSPQSLHKMGNALVLWLYEQDRPK